jgi:hypothetical protein
MYEIFSAFKARPFQGIRNSFALKKQPSFYSFRCAIWELVANNRPLDYLILYNYFFPQNISQHMNFSAKSCAQLRSPQIAICAKGRVGLHPYGTKINPGGKICALDAE